MDIIPLIIGVHTAIDRPDGVSLPGHTGAVTLLSHNHERILVDVGGRGTWDTLCERLTRHKLSPDDITHIILTHLHLDHSYNIARFPQARIFAWKHEWRAGETFRFGKIEAAPLPPYIHLLPTPGHAEEHIAVMVEEGGRRVIMAGDALNEDYARTGEISTYCYDEKLYRASAAKILSLADRIIPGHGEPFEVR